MQLLKNNNLLKLFKKSLSLIAAMCRHLKIDHMKLSRRLICNDDIKHDADPHHKFQCIALVLPLIDALHISHNLCAFLKCSINFINFFLPYAITPYYFLVVMLKGEVDSFRLQLQLRNLEYMENIFFN